MYRTVKRLGIPDSQIIMMLADDMACNPRNIWPAQVFDNENHRVNLYGTSIEVDYRGYEVSVESMIRVLTGRHDKSTPRSKRLLSDANSNIFIYMTGHGGEEFLKFQDVEEVSSHDLADAFEQMSEKKRYREILFMVDTCQASTLYRQFHSPNIVAIGSSKLKENSYSHHSDSVLGVSVIDRFTFHTLDYFEHIQPNSNKTVSDLFNKYNFQDIQSHVEWREDLYQQPLKDVLLTDFFGSVTHTQTTSTKYNLQKRDHTEAITRSEEHVPESEPQQTQTRKEGNVWNVYSVSSIAALGVILVALQFAEKK